MVSGVRMRSGNDGRRSQPGGQRLVRKQGVASERLERSRKNITESSVSM